ncbi:MAG: dihydropteroate synthase [Candidatus Omnitrophica bacterium]|nr:dihydropteroate synthase [Candidatus Omnitrophota bacterium]
MRPVYEITVGGRRYHLGARTSVMGILNVTPDSFSNDGLRIKKPGDVRAAAERACRMAEAGADIIDIGGESTRPQAAAVSAAEEVRRVIPVVKAIAGKLRVPISVDTYKVSVARAALDAGATIINTIQGCSLGEKPEQSLLRAVRNYCAAVVLMHMRGKPRTMQKNIHYGNAVQEIYDALRRAVNICLDAGIRRDKIIIDPGIGFGKTTAHNLEIINRLDSFHQIGQPVLIGPSRKFFIGEILNAAVENRLSGTIAAVCAAVSRGAHIVRVHDVRPIVEAVRVMDSVLLEKAV